MKIKDIILWPTYHPLLSFLWFYIFLLVYGAMMSGLFPNTPKDPIAVAYEWLEEASPALSNLLVFLALPGFIIGPYGTVGFLVRRALASKQVETETNDPDSTGAI